VEPKFIVDANVGKLARWLRMMGYDALFFNEQDDGKMVKLALAQQRTIITKDSEFMKRRAVASGRVPALLVMGDNPDLQMQTVLYALHLGNELKPFTRCLECNAELTAREKEKVAESVPPRVYQIQEQYMQCPACRRIYWHGTHWQAMSRKLVEFSSSQVQKAKGANL